MSLRRNVMRNFARRQADEYRRATMNNRKSGARRDKRILMRAAFSDLGSVSTRDGNLRINQGHGKSQRMDYFKDDAYQFMRPSKAKQNARKLLGIKEKPDLLHRPWAGNLR